MVQRIETENPEIFAVKVSGTLTEEDYQFLSPAMEGEIQKQDKMNLYWEMANFDGWTPGGLWEDVKFDARHLTNFKKIALVGDKKWEKWLTNLMKPFTTAQVQFFDYADRDAARTWVGL